MARMLGKSSQRPYVYGVGTGRMKKCFGCWDGCGYDADNGTQRAREKRAVAHEVQAGIVEREVDEQEWILERIYGPHAFDSRCPRDGLTCTCNDDRCIPAELTPARG